MSKLKIYLIGSLRNPEVLKYAALLRAEGFEVFDDWYAAGHEADDMWKAYEQDRGHSYMQAMDGYSAAHVFHFDCDHLDDSDAGVLILPAGKSGHLELGYLAGQGKPTFILLEAGEDPRWDVMYMFSGHTVRGKHGVCETIDEVLVQLHSIKGTTNVQ